MDLSNFRTPTPIPSPSATPATEAQKHLLCHLARYAHGLVDADLDVMEWLADSYTVNMDSLTVEEFLNIKYHLLGES